MSGGLPGKTFIGNLVYPGEEKKNSFLANFGKYGNEIAAEEEAAAAAAAAAPMPKKSILKKSLKYSNIIPAGSVKIDAIAAHILAIATEQASYDYNLNTTYYNRTGRMYSGKNLIKSNINQHVENVLSIYKNIYLKHGIPEDRANAFIDDLRERVNRDIDKILYSRRENNSVISVNWKRNSVNIKERGEEPFPATLQLESSPANNILNEFYSIIIKLHGPFYLDNKISINKFKRILTFMVNNVMFSWPYIKIGTNTYVLNTPLKHELLNNTKSFMEYLDSEKPNLSRERVFMGGLRRKTVRRRRGKGTRRG